MSTPSTLLPVVLISRGRRFDLAVTAEARLVDILANQHLRASDASVLTSAGTELNQHEPLADQIQPGAVLWIVDQSTGAQRHPGPESGDRLTARVRTGARGWLVCALVVALCGVVIVSHLGLLGDQAWDQPGWMRYLLVGILGATALLLSVWERPGVGGSARISLVYHTVLAPIFGFTAGFLLADPAGFGVHSLALVLGMISAATAAVIRFAVNRRLADQAEPVAAVLAWVWTVLAVLFATALLIDLPHYVVPTLVLGASPLIMRAMPSASLDIDDEDLLDLPFLDSRANSVRRPAPSPPRRVRWEQVQSEIRYAERRKTTGLIAASVLIAATAPVVLAAFEPGGFRGWGTIALFAAVLLFLALAPRTYRRRTEKVVPRLALFSILAQLALAIADRPDVLLWTFAAIGLSIGVAFLAIPLTRGYRSVRWSHLGDIIESLAVVLALPAALFAAGAIEGLQTLTSR